MNSLPLFFRSTLKEPLIWLISAILLLVSFFSFGYASVNKILPCAICSEDLSEDSSRLFEDLDPDQFIFCENRAEVLKMMRRGKADCGAVVLSGFSEKLASGAPEASVEILVSPRTALDARYKFLILGTIYKTYAPYLTIKGFDEFGLSITLEEVAEYFERIQPDIKPLTFLVTNVDGANVGNKPGIDLPVGLISIAVFIAYGFFAIGIVRRRSRIVKPRFSNRRLLFNVYLPRLIPACALIFFSASAGILLGQILLDFAAWRLIAGLFLYMILLTVLFSIMIQIRLSDHVWICVIALEATISLLLCPLFWDVTLYLTWFKAIRFFCVPYWLYTLI